MHTTFFHNYARIIILAVKIKSQNTKCTIALIDKLDKEILSILSTNSRITITELAELTDSSKPTISRKIKNLEESGVVKGYVSIVDDKVSGIGCRGIMMVNLSGEADVEKLLNDLENMPQICTMFLTFGRYDLFLMALVKDTTEFYMIFDEVRSMDGVVSVDTSTVISRRKFLNKKITE